MGELCLRTVTEQSWRVRYLIARLCQRNWPLWQHGDVVAPPRSEFEPRCSVEGWNVHY